MVHWPVQGYDIVVTKLNAAGNNLIGSRKIGGSGSDGVNITENRDLVSLQRNYGDDGRSEIILDGSGNVYVASCTQSTNFPGTTGFFQASSGGSQDGVVLKFSPNLSVLNFASYIGGSGNDAAYVLALAPNGNIYVGGGTESGDLLPGTHGVHWERLSRVAIDGFVAVISNNGVQCYPLHLYWYGHGIDQVFGIQFDLNGFPYIMGQTTGNWAV